MTTARRLHHSYEEYLEALEASPIKLEYCEGEIFAVAGGTPLHADLAARMIQILANQLGQDCRVSSSDLKVRVEATDLTTFPDVTVVCGPRQTSSIDANAVVNPTLLVEITSRSTEDYDRGEKLSHYRQLPSLHAVVLVSHARRQLTLVQRTPSGFSTTEFRSGEALELAGPALLVPVDAVYEGLDVRAD